MKNKYDYIIIGAGPAGLFSAYTLGKKNNGKKKILLIDKGSCYDKRKCPLLHSSNRCACSHCSIISGIGGAAFYIPAKLSNYPAGSKLLNFFENENICKDAYSVVLNIFRQLGLNASDQENLFYNEKYQELKSLADKNDMFLKYYFSQEHSQDSFADFIKKLLCELESFGVEIYPNTEIIDIYKHDYFKLKDKNKNEYIADKVIIAIGESGAFWWNETVKKLGIAKRETSIDVGVRIEFQSQIIKNIYSYHKDPKIIFKAPDGSELRSYCTLSNGKVVICRNDDFRVVDGIHCNYDNGIGAMTLFNRIYPTKDIMEFASDISNIVREKCDGKIALGTVGMLLNNDDNGNISNSPTLKYTQEISLDEVIPTQILHNLKYGILQLSKIIPGIENPSNTVYFPAIDKMWCELILATDFETSIKNLYVVGDATGIARGIFQSALMGYYCGTKI